MGSQEFHDFMEPSSPTSAGSSLSSLYDKQSKWMRESSHRSLTRTSAVAALIKAQDMSSSTNSRQVACERGCTMDGQAPRWPPLKATLKNGCRGSRGYLDQGNCSDKSSSRVPRWKLLWGDDDLH